MNPLQELLIRAVTLEKGITELLQDTGLKDKVYAHPLLQGIQLKNGNKPRLPSYISSKIFVLALMDVLTGSSAADNGSAPA